MLRSKLSGVERLAGVVGFPPDFSAASWGADIHANNSTSKKDVMQLCCTSGDRIQIAFNEAQGGFLGPNKTAKV
jgi:hypothetical protein